RHGGGRLCEARSRAHGRARLRRHSRDRRSDPGRRRSHARTGGSRSCSSPHHLRRSREIPMKTLLPPVLVLIIAILMSVATGVVPAPVILPAPYNWFGLVLLLAGFALGLTGARHFNKVGTNIPTFNDPTILVTDGLFKWSRNPIYLGFTLFLSGLAVMLGT